MLVKIAEALKRTNYEPLKQIELYQDQETVVLVGLVPSYFLKQVAQVAAMSVTGVSRIENQLRVADEGEDQEELEPSRLPSPFGGEPPRSEFSAIFAYA